MALFLSEAVNNYERKQIGYGNSSMTEAALMLLNISEQSAALTEAVMTAEFTLMRQCRNLSEGETSNKMKDFGKKVWHNLKAFAKTVWAKIKEICRMVWRKLKEWGSNVLDMFSGKEMEISKITQRYLEYIPRKLEKFIFLLEKGVTASEDAADSLFESLNDLYKEMEEEGNAVKKESEQNSRKVKNNDIDVLFVRVGKNWLKSVQNSTSKLSSQLEKLVEKLDKRTDEMEKFGDRMSDDDNKKDMGKASEKFKKFVELAKRAAKILVEISSVATKVGRAVGKNEGSSKSRNDRVEALQKQLEKETDPDKRKEIQEKIDEIDKQHTEINEGRMKELDDYRPLAEKLAELYERHVEKEDEPKTFIQKAAKVLSAVAGSAKNIRITKSTLAGALATAGMAAYAAKDVLVSYIPQIIDMAHSLFGLTASVT